MDRYLAYLLGITTDAHYICRPKKNEFGLEIEQNQREFILHIAALFKYVFNVDPSLKLRSRSWGTYYRMRIYSKNVYKRLRKYDFVTCLRAYSPYIQRELIRGFFDAKGSAHQQILFFNKDKRILSTIKTILYCEFSIKSGKIFERGQTFILPIYSEQDKQLFMKTIKPRHPDKQY